MKIVHLSYQVPKPVFTDPYVWLKRINFSVGVIEAMAAYAEVIGIFHIHYKGILVKDRVTYHFPGFNRWQLLVPFRFNHYVEKLSPDVVIVHGLISPWQIIMLRFQVGRHLKIIVQHHAERPLRDVRQYFQRWADRYISAYLFASNDLGKLWVEEKLIGHSTKIKEVMEASSPFYPMDKQQARLISQTKDEKVYLWVGRLDTNKDPLIVVRAFARFAKSNPVASLYMIYHTFQLQKELETLVRQTDASRYLHLVGKIENPDLLYWYNSADFIISSSHYEGSGIAVCEAMSCGCIPVLTDNPSFRMMTANGAIGILYEAGNEDALVNALYKSQQLNLEGEREKVLERFNNELSFDAIAKKTMQVIHEIE
jgi:glycosyltransferase involved in cell wall biosynthesis